MQAQIGGAGDEDAEHHRGGIGTVFAADRIVRRLAVDLQRGHELRSAAEIRSSGSVGDAVRPATTARATEAAKAAWSTAGETPIGVT